VVPVPSTDQVVALAPDASALKSARELASARRWTLLGRSDDWLWGLAQGSGANPYQVQVALGELASKCSCPSRKFPCKHALGLLLLAAENAAAVATATPPAWVAEWAAARAQRAEKQEAKKARTAEEKPVDAAQQQKRQEKRAARIDEGAALLRQALQDLVRGGLAAVTSGAELWPDLDRRMVDAQAPGLGARIASLRSLLQAGPARREQALDELGQLHTLLCALEPANAGREPLQQSLRQAVGVPLRSDDVLQHAGVDDRWFVAAVDTLEQDHLVTTVQWLFGLTSRRWANVLHSAPVQQARTAERFPLGVVVRGELVFAPTAAPQRGLFRTPPRVLVEAAPEPADFGELLARHAASLAAEPWWRMSPFHVAAAPAWCGDTPVLVDGDGRSLPWQPRGGQATVLAAITGGGRCPIAGTWDGRQLHVLAARDELGMLDLAGATP
jgi:hypothetical protein